MNEHFNFTARQPMSRWKLLNQMSKSGEFIVVSYLHKLTVILPVQFPSKRHPH
jgi:hypothetical protein